MVRLPAVRMYGDLSLFPPRQCIHDLDEAKEQLARLEEAFSRM